MKEKRGHERRREECRRTGKEKCREVGERCERRRVEGRR